MAVLFGRWGMILRVFGEVLTLFRIERVPGRKAWHFDEALRFGHGEGDFVGDEGGRSLRCCDAALKDRW